MTYLKCLDNIQRRLSRGIIDVQKDICLVRRERLGNHKEMADLRRGVQEKESRKKTGRREMLRKTNISRGENGQLHTSQRGKRGSVGQ